MYYAEYLAVQGSKNGFICFLVSEYPTGRLVILEDPSRVIRSEWLLETKMLKFEDMDFPVPSGYEYLLKLWYGNYMEIPEEGKEYLRKEQMEE